MKKIIGFKFGILLVFVFWGCSKKYYPAIAELKVVDRGYVIQNHDLGKFLFGINPISYTKTKNTIRLRGVISYPGKDLYSKAFDTLIVGIKNIKIYYGELKSNVIIAKEIGKGDCNGIFDINFERKKNSYLIFDGENLNPTGLNTKYFFLLYENVYESSLIIKDPLCK